MRASEVKMTVVAALDSILLLLLSLLLLVAVVFALLLGAVKLWELLMLTAGCCFCCQPKRESRKNAL